MGDWPAAASGGAPLATGLAATTTPIVLASGSSNVKGNWVEIFSAAQNVGGAAGLSAMIVGPGSGGSMGLIDIGVGASSSEQVLVANLIDDGLAGIKGTIYNLPITIPPGVRIVARSQINTGPSNAYIHLVLLSRDFMQNIGCGESGTYGAETADSSGTQIDAGGTVNTKGSWVQLTASCKATRALLLGAASIVAGSSTSRFQIDLGIGGAGSEQVVVPDIGMVRDPSFDAIMPGAFGPFPVSIPEGTRIAARTQSADNSAGTRVLDVIAYGFN